MTTYELSKFGSYANTVKVNGTAVTLPIQVAAGATIEVTSTDYDASTYSMIWSGPTPTSNHTVLVVLLLQELLHLLCQAKTL